MTERICPERPHLLDGYPIGMYHCPACGCMVLAGMAHTEHEPEACYLGDHSEDEFVEMVAGYEAGYARVLDPSTKPREQLPRLVNSFVWVWLTGPVEPHWAIRGTGLIVDEPLDRHEPS